MLRSLVVTSLALLAARALSGCARVDPQADYARAVEMIRLASGEGAVWMPGDGGEAAPAPVDLLAGGLTAGEAVRVALLGNRELQAVFYEIGIARAAVVQAGLLSNPSLGAALRLPLDGGASVVEATLVANLIEVFRLPARTGAAEVKLEVAILGVADAASRIAAETRRVYWTAVAAEQALRVEEENLDTVRELLDLTRARQQAGAATEVDVNVVRARVLGQEVATRDARLGAFEARSALAVLLGLDLLPDEVVLADRLDSAAPAIPGTTALLEAARLHRLDLEIARQEVFAAEQEVRLQFGRIFETVAPGADLEADGDHITLGPAVDFALPIFDQNQAGIARARLRRGRAGKRLHAVELAAAQEVRVAAARFHAARDVVEAYTERVLPLARESLALAEEAFRAGTSGFLAVLEVEREFLAVHHDYVERLRALALTLPDLERATGRPLSALVAAAGDAGTPSSEAGRKSPDTKEQRSR